jgi:hypothetical protein|tara:strand:+ start:258 stop:455 length:198 start_codon:yes stop_codon:yes gene_type:complete
MERLDYRGVEYEMKRDLSIDIMQYILNEFDCKVRKEIIIDSCVYEFGKKHEPTIKSLTELIGGQL